MIFIEMIRAEAVLHRMVRFSKLREFPDEWGELALGVGGTRGRADEIGALR
ncbi:MAG: hypothetical protein Ct9H300mP8_03700 [Gammaproteobacteria bacterium]|nr:MAG: hypothetical protein Ct9H300mP8_03700 [Gammaproteobacteria bacterium]